MPNPITEMSDTASSADTEMPGAVQGEVEEVPMSELLRFGTDLHKKTLERLISRVDLSERHMGTRYDNMDRVDEHVRCYINLDRKRRLGDGSTDTDHYEMPFDQGIVVPASYTILWTRLTGLLGIFGNRTPIYQIESGGGPEDVDPAKSMETMIAYDTRQMGDILPLFAMLQDAEKYGFGVVCDEWYEEKGYTYKENPIAQSPQVAQLFQLITGGPPPRALREYGVAKEYNKWSPVDPFNFLPDPRVPLSAIDRAEFCGHISPKSYLHLVENEEPDGPYFNVKEARTHNQDKTSANTSGTSSRSRNNLSDFALPNSGDERDKGFYNVINIQVRLIPKDWNLSDTTTPERWQFAICSRAVIIRAHPLPYDHGKFTYGIAEPTYDPHTLFNPGPVELLDGMQRMMNWLFSSHLENVRRMINNAAIFSPMYIEEEDIRNPTPGGHIRMTEAGERLVKMGFPISNFFQQANIMDLTGGHLKTSEYMFEMMKLMSAINDPAMGQPTPSKRTLGEIQRIVFSQEQRIATTARIVDSLALRPLIERAIMNRQQWTSLQQYFKIIGENAAGLEDPYALLGREDILGNFNYVANTGTVPPDPARFAEMWIEVMQAAAQIPMLFEPDEEGKVFDITGVFDEFIERVGIKNKDKFYKYVAMIPAPEVMSDEDVAAGVQSGNLIPAGNGPVETMRGAASAA